MENSEKGLRAEVTNYLRLTDAAIRAATLPPGKSQHYLHDTEQPGLAIRMRATGGRTWVFLFTKPGTRGTQRKTLGAWPKFNEKAARKAAIIAAGEVVIGVDPNDAKREAKRQQLAEKQCTTLATLIIEDGPYETSLTGRQVVNWKPAMSALRRGLKDHFDLAIGELTRRQIMAAVDKIAKTGKRGAAKDLRKHTHTLLEWCVGEGYVEHNVLAGYRAPKETRAQRVGRRTKGRALIDEEIIKVWHASGTLFMDTYAMQAAYHMKRHGTTQRQIAVCAAKNHSVAANNEKAQYRFEMTPDEVLEDRDVSWPLTRAMCAPIGDGAAAALICSSDYLATLPVNVRERAVKLRASVLTNGHLKAPQDPSLSQAAAKKAYAATGLTPSDIHVAEVHDATSFCEIYQSEMLGFCEPGQGGKLAESGATALGGRIPINTSGGLVSKGHPVGATGLSMIYELVTQLRGEAGQRQVKDARIALQENGGGLIGFEEAVCSVAILERND